MKCVKRVGSRTNAELIATISSTAMISAAEIIADRPGKFFDCRLVTLWGAAGAGKTFLLHSIASMSGNTLLLAPTHFLKRSSEERFRTVRTVAWAALTSKREFSSFRTVMITEAAMVRDVEITAIIRKLANGTTLYLDCDPYQISAITESGTKSILGSASFMQLSKRPSTRCYLMTEQYRTRNKMVIAVIDAIQQQRKDQLLENMLQLISSSLADPAEVPYNDQDIVVSHTNAIRNYVWSVLCAQRGFEMEEGTNLVLGHQVRLRVTKKRPGKRKKEIVYANGDMCTLLQVTPTHVLVQLDDETEHNVPHMPDGSPAVSQTGCFTAYSVQGMTAPENVYVVCDTPSAPPPICVSTLYVMLTRARSQNVDGPPDKLHFVVHNWVRFRDALTHKILSAPFTAFQEELCKHLVSLS